LAHGSKLKCGTFLASTVLISNNFMKAQVWWMKQKGLFSSGFVMKDEHGFGFYVE